MQLLFVQGAGEGSYDWDLPLVRAIGEKLDQKFTLHYPKMPNEEEPSYHLWKRSLLKEIEGATEPLAIIGHSHGGSVILKLLSEEKIPKDIRALFLVSTPFWGEPDWQSDTYVLDDDFADKLPVTAHQFIYHAEDDDIVHFEQHKRYSAKLPNATVRTFGRGGHEMLSAVETFVADIHGLKV